MAKKMSTEVIIEVKDVYKSFRVYYDKGSMLKEQFVNPGRSRYEEREILKGISFKVHRGETLALIGQNGCGKSTTLKMLTKILYPNKGTVTVNGKVSSLIELGAGFHPDMSGRENIYINASILGIKKEEVDKRIDEIIRFSELEEYIDNPIRTYSSGMYMRLAFSVAINVDADILLIDEILAVGDQAFQEKCIRKLDEQRAAGVTVVLVSHSMDQIQKIADRCIWIDKGRIVEDGSTKFVCKHYNEAMTARREWRDDKEEREREDVQEQTQSTDEGTQYTKAVVTPPESERIKREKKREAIRKERREEFSKRWKGGGSQGIPLVGFIAALLMMLCHASQDIYGLGYEKLSEGLTLNMKYAGYSLFSIGRVGIPVFLIVMGFTLLSQDYGSRKLRLGFYKDKVLPLFIIWEIWLIIYELFLHIWIGRSINISTWIREALFIDYTDLSHAWFARTFFILLILTPYIANLLQWMRTGLFRLLMLLVWICFFFFPGLDQYGQLLGGNPSIPTVPGTVCYLFYMCMGYMLSMYTRRLMRGSREVLILIISLIATVLTQILLDRSNIDYLIWYTYYGVSLIAIFGFDIAVRIKLDALSKKAIAFLADIYGCVIGVYLVHRPIQMFLCRYVFMNGKGFIGGANGAFAIRTIILWILSSIASFTIVYLIRKVPKVGQRGRCGQFLGLTKP